MGDLGLPVWADMVVQRGRGWTPNLGRFGHPTWTSVGIHYGRSWASNVGRSGCPIWTEVDFQRGRGWSSNMDGVGLQRWAEVDTQYGQDADVQACPLQGARSRPLSDAHNYASIMGAHCWAAILWGYVVVHYWASTHAQ